MIEINNEFLNKMPLFIHHQRSDDCKLKDSEIHSTIDMKKIITDHYLSPHKKIISIKKKRSNGGEE
jgi:hypothetical protein